MRLRRRGLVFAVALVATLAGLVLAACGGDDDGGDGRPEVIATTTQIGALVRDIAGDRVALTVLLQAGADAHDYEASPQDSRRIRSAALVLKNGLGLDDWLDDLIKNSGTKAKVWVVTDGVNVLEAEHGGEEQGHEGEDDYGHEDEKDEHGHAHGDVDPHVWHDPENVKVMVRNIADALADVDPDGAAGYRERAEAYAARLDAVDAEIKQLFAPIPTGSRKIVTNHEALRYFAKRYEVTVVGAIIPGTSKETQPSAQDLARLTDLIRSEGVRVIVAEAEIEPRIAEQLAKETGVKIVTGLYADSLGPAGSGADTVDGMLLHNARLLAEALR